MHLLVALVGVELLELLPRLRLSPLRPTLDHEVKQVGRPASPCGRPDASARIPILRISAKKGQITIGHQGTGGWASTSPSTVPGAPVREQNLASSITEHLPLADAVEAVHPNGAQDQRPVPPHLRPQRGTGGAR